MKFEFSIKLLVSLIFDGCNFVKIEFLKLIDIVFSSHLLGFVWLNDVDFETPSIIVLECSVKSNKPVSSI